MMKFKFKNIMERGVKIHIVTCIAGVLDEEQLPKEYMEGFRENEPYLYNKGNDEIYLWMPSKHGSRTLYPGKKIKCDEIDTIIKEIRAAGSRLHKINQRIKKEAENWDGVEWEVSI